MKWLLILLILVNNLATSCKIDSPFSKKGTGTLVGYISHPSKNDPSQVNQPLILKIEKDNKIIYEDSVGIGEFKLDSLPEGQYEVNYYSLKYPDSSTQKSVQVKSGMVSFVSIKAFCSVSISITPHPEYVVPYDEYINSNGSAEGYIELDQLANKHAYIDKYKDKKPVPTVEFYKRNINAGNEIIPWEKMHTTHPDNKKYSLDSLPTGFYQAIVRLDPYVSFEVYNILVLPNKIALVDFDRFHYPDMLGSLSDCFHFQYETWKPKYRE